MSPNGIHAKQHMGIIVYTISLVVLSTVSIHSVEASTVNSDLIDVFGKGSTYSVRFTTKEMPEGSMTFPMVLADKTWSCCLNDVDQAEREVRVKPEEPPPQIPVPTAADIQRHASACFNVGDCFLYDTRDWWRYEFCYDKWARQYHEDEHGVHDEFFLGLGVRALDRDTIGLRKIPYIKKAPALLVHTLERLVTSHPTHHLQTSVWGYENPPDSPHGAYYTKTFFQGTQCDLTELWRDTEIRVYCTVDTSKNGTFEVDEYTSCRYRLTFWSFLACSFPEMHLALPRQPTTAPAHTIWCFGDVNAVDTEPATTTHAVQPGTEEESTSGSDDVDAVTYSDKDLRGTMQATELLGEKCYEMPTHGWWHYEFCAKKWIRQYHVDESGKCTDEFYLGIGHEALVADQHYERIVDYGNPEKGIVGGEMAVGEKMKEHLTPNVLSGKVALKSTGMWKWVDSDPQSAHPYFSTDFYQGTMCDVTAQPREIEIRLYCSVETENNERTDFFNVEEKDSCRYILKLSLEEICNWDDMIAYYAEQQQYHHRRAYTPPQQQQEYAQQEAYNYEQQQAEQQGQATEAAQQAAYEEQQRQYEQQQQYEQQRQYEQQQAQQQYDEQQQQQQREQEQQQQQTQQQSEDSGEASQQQQQQQAATQQQQSSQGNNQQQQPPKVSMAAVRAIVHQLDTSYTGRCFESEVGWWKYQYCYNKWLRQYHEDGSGVVEAEYWLGFGSAAFYPDPIGDAVEEYLDGERSMIQQIYKEHPSLLQTLDGYSNAWSLVQHSKGKNKYYLSTNFAHGTTCEATQQSRRVEIRTMCSKNMRIVNTFTVTEASTCEYVLTFFTKDACLDLVKEGKTADGIHDEL